MKEQDTLIIKAMPTSQNQDKRKNHITDQKILILNQNQKYFVQAYHFVDHLANMFDI